DCISGNREKRSLFTRPIKRLGNKDLLRSDWNLGSDSFNSRTQLQTIETRYSSSSHLITSRLSIHLTKTAT
ncbi:MAG: hypothetical protein AB1589_42000, partial [Cyanobacteriota bacterium]